MTLPFQENPVSHYQAVWCYSIPITIKSPSAIHPRVLERVFSGGGMPFQANQFGLGKTLEWNLETSSTVVEFPPPYLYINGIISNNNHLSYHKSKFNQKLLHMTFSGIVCYIYNQFLFITNANKNVNYYCWNVKQLVNLCNVRAWKNGCTKGDNSL